MPLSILGGRFAVAVALIALPLALLWPRGHAATEPSFDPHAVPRVSSLAALERRDLLLPAGPAAVCGAELVIASALVDPDDRPDREGEEVTLVNLGAVPIELTGWRLTSGRRKLTLPAWGLGPGEPVTLGGDGPLPLRPLQLGNTRGELVLSDPCGLVRARLHWGGACPRPAPGWRVEAPAWRRLGPARSVTGGADGGCGQT